MELIVYCDKAIDKLISIDMKVINATKQMNQEGVGRDRQRQRKRQRGKEKDVLATNIKKGPL